MHGNLKNDIYRLVYSVAKINTQKNRIEKGIK